MPGVTFRSRCHYLPASLCTLLIVASRFGVLFAGELQPTNPTTAQADEARLIGQPVSLIVHPEAIRLTGPRATQQVLVTGRYADGSERDLTRVCTFSFDVADIATVSATGYLQPQKTGSTALIARAGGQVAQVPVTIEKFDIPLPVSFRHDLIAALNVAGCNAGACHGIPSGRGGFKLSLRGYDPAADFVDGITAQSLVCIEHIRIIARTAGQDVIQRVPRQCVGQ